VAAPADGVAGHSQEPSAGFARGCGELRVPFGRAGFRAAIDLGTARSDEAAAGAGDAGDLHLGGFRRRRDADAGTARTVAGRQTPAASLAAEGLDLLVRLREPERRLAMDGAGPDSDPA